MVKKFGRQISPGRFCPHAGTQFDVCCLISTRAGANELFGAAVMSSDWCFLGVQKDTALCLFFFFLCIRCHYGLAQLSVSVAFYRSEHSVVSPSPAQHLTTHKEKLTLTPVGSTGGTDGI